MGSTSVRHATDKPSYGFYSYKLATKYGCSIHLGELVGRDNQPNPHDAAHDAFD